MGGLRDLLYDPCSCIVGNWRRVKPLVGEAILPGRIRAQLNIVYGLHRGGWDAEL